MLAVARTRRTRRDIRSRYVFSFRRTTPRRVLAEVSRKYRAYIDNAAGGDNELINIADTEWYRKMEKDMTPGKMLKTLREVCNLTQAQLGEMIGTPASRISDYETGQRQMSKGAAKRLGKALKVSPAVFI